VQTVLHGDMHHYNVLRASGPSGSRSTEGTGRDRCFDVCQFFRNPMPAGVAPAVNSRRLDIFCSELGLDRGRTKDWCLVHAMLDACWGFEDGNPWQRAVAYAETTLTFLSRLDIGDAGGGARRPSEELPSWRMSIELIGEDTSLHVARRL